MKLKYIILLAVIIILPILILTFIPYKTLVRLELEVTEVSFESLDPIQNFFSLENSYEKIEKISLQSYDSIFYYMDGFKNEKISSSDITDKITLYDVGINEMLIDRNSLINIKSNKHELNKYIIQVSKNEHPISFKSNTDTLSLKIKNEPIKKIFNSLIDKVEVIPSEKMLKMNISMNETYTTEEEEVIRANNISFQKNINGKLYSSIKSGEIELMDINKKYDVTKNATVLLPSDVKFQIMSLSIKKGKIHITLEGFTSKIFYGLNNRNIAPSLLFYLSNNNFLLTLINTFLIILTFIISIIKFSNEGK